MWGPRVDAHCENSLSGGVGGILSVVIVKIALSKAPEYSSLNLCTVFVSNANELF